jgi:hypothetical protein
MIDFLSASIVLTALVNLIRVWNWKRIREDFDFTLTDIA